MATNEISTTHKDRVRAGDPTAIQLEVEQGLLAIAAVAKELNIRFVEESGVFGGTHLIEREAERLYALLDRPPTPEKRKAAIERPTDEAASERGDEPETKLKGTVPQTAQERAATSLGILQDIATEIVHLARLGSQDTEDPHTTCQAIERIANEAYELLHGETWDMLLNALERS